MPARQAVKWVPLQAQSVAEAQDEFRKIRPYRITARLQKLKESGKANRTCDLTLVMLRNVLKSARGDGFIKTLPVVGALPLVPRSGRVGIFGSCANSPALAPRSNSCLTGLHEPVSTRFDG